MANGVGTLNMAVSVFEVISEIEPATRPDLTRVRHQVGSATRLSPTLS